MNNNKEFRIFVVDADLADTSGYNIENWKHYENAHGELLEETKEFIEQARENGRIYDLEGFQNAMNLEEDSLINSWIYITNNY